MGIKKILVTGSSGTIGTRLSERLLAEGYHVIGCDWKPNAWNKTVEEKTVRLDIRDKNKLLLELPKDVDMVIHLAANARVYNLVVEPSMARDNFETTFNILEYCRINNINNFIFASSRETYRNTDKAVHSEDEVELKNCESPYTASKIGGEALVHSYNECYGINYITFRFSNVYGMYDDSDRVIPLFIKLCRENKPLVVFGKDKLLDFTYIDDTINGIIMSIKDYDNVKNNVYNLAYGEGTTILEVAETIKRMMGTDNKIMVNDNRTGEVVKYIADITRAKNNIGYAPKTTIGEGLRKTIDWYNSNG